MQPCYNGAVAVTARNPASILWKDTPSPATCSCLEEGGGECCTMYSIIILSCPIKRPNRMTQRYIL